jgi:FAD/FMN-containing dehydrogenase
MAEDGSMELSAPPETLKFIEGLRTILSHDNVHTELSERIFYSTDIFEQGVTAELVISPSSAELAAKAVAYCTQAGRAVAPRGGGFSYTQGYIPVTAPTVVLDLRGLDRIVEINTEDMWVKVEAGVTWVALYEALKARGYRTPFFGPMSGFRSTVGGALSQGAFFLGSTQYGTGAESTLGLDVVLADGTQVTTGSAGSKTMASPFMRNYGPDLTGLFLHDCGALAIKTAAYLRLIPLPAHQRFASFAFEDQRAGLAAMSDIARQGLAAECYLWDPTFVRRMRARNSLVDDLRYLKGVVSAGSSIFGGLRDAAKLATAGKRVLDGDTYLLHVVCEDSIEAIVEARQEAIRALAAEQDGGEVSDSIARAMRAGPFTDFVSLGRAVPQLRNLPIHGLFPHSRIDAVSSDVDQFFIQNKALMDQHEITQGTICFAVGSTAMCIEPLLFWTDPQLAAHDRFNSVSDLSVLAKFPKRTAAAQVVEDLRRQLVQLFAEHGAAHAQIGRAYPYRESRSPELYGLLEKIKDAVDPKGLINPQALGLIKGAR